MRNKLSSWRGPKAMDRTEQRRRTGGQSVRPPDPELLKRAQDATLVLHMGLHKTASTYVQGVLSARRDDLLREGLLYPRTGIVEKGSTGTREGAGSGQGLLSRKGRQEALKAQLLEELPEDVPTVLVSSEEFSRARPTPTPHNLLARFRAFGTVKVVLVLRRQDDWIESYYKQIVDQYNNFETRSFDKYFEETGRSLLDFHSRFTPWRDLVGPENFHVLSYDDLADGAAICRRILEISGLSGPILDELATVPVPRYESVRAIDTVGLRILNAYRLDDRETRTKTARSVYDAAPAGDIELMSPDLREEIQAMCRPINERIEAEWFDEPVPGLRFGAEPRASAKNPPSGPEMIDYVNRVMSLCEDARTTLNPEAMWQSEAE